MGNDERSSEPRLLADIGGTNARFAWQEQPGMPIRHAAVLACDEYAGLAEAIRAYLEMIGRAAPDHCGIAIATRVLGDRIAMTNRGWAFSIQSLQEAFGFRKLVVLNDFAALAMALPTLSASDTRQLGGLVAQPRAPKVVLGPGTGLGVSALLPIDDAGWTALAGEGGHATLAASNRREAEIIDRLREDVRHVSAERALSGAGLEALHRAVQGTPANVERLDAAAIVRRAIANSDSTCREAVDLFCGLLGSFAGNLALTFDARGGVYIGGGIVPRLGHLLDESAFRVRFEAKGRSSSYLASIPVFLIQADRSPALRGAAIAIDRAAA
jgi:glucokinase